ncbi:MAG: peptidoglycan DD-metalloendopeptidase family protein [Clostridiales bacterium]|nr:peptidoglycan DD-metalloendopeptidase family protein [Clostridiales bacterium]
MNNKKVISVIAVIMAVLMLMTLIISVIPTSAYALVTQADIDEAQRKKDELVSQRQASQEKIDKLKEQQASVLEQKAALDERNEYAREQLTIVLEQIDMYSEMIAEKRKEVDEARTKEEEQLRRYRTRVRAMEENGGYNILTLVFNASSFTELLTSLDDIGEIMEQDRQLEDEYIAAREAHEAVQAEYEAEKAELEAKQAELEAEKAELEGLIAEADQLLKELEEDIEKAIKEYEIAEAARAAAAAHLSALVAALNKQNQEIANSNNNANNGGGSGDTGSTSGDTADSGSADGGSTSGGAAGGGSTDSGSSSGSGGLISAGSEGVQGTGSLVWPVPCSHTVTSRFGWRVHPITGTERYHNGMDIDGYGHDGDIIIACDAGVVVAAQWSDSYGYYIMIDHGNGMQTLYAHMSGMAVSYGTKVSQGQTIGYLGSTGWSTGTHCHLEIYVNGSRTDPEAYFSGMTFYDC